MSRRLFILLIVLSVTVTACNRQASDPVNVVSNAQSADGQVSATPMTIAEATEDITPSPEPTVTEGIPVITSTAVEPTATDIPATETETTTPTATVPTATPTITMTSTSVMSPTFTAQPLNTDIPTNTPFSAAVQATETNLPTETATAIAVQPTNTTVPTNTPVPTNTIMPTSTIIPTETTMPTVVTPGSPQGNNSAINTPTPLPTNTPAMTLEPTPTDFGDTTTDNTDAATDTEDPTTTTEREVSEECIYVVQRGDNLFRIALNNGVTLNAMIAANPSIVTPTLILPGDELVIPGCEPTEPETVIPPAGGEGEEDRGILGNGETLHRVVAGETLLQISRRYGVTINALVERNSLADPNRLSVGQELIIPPPGN